MKYERGTINDSKYRSVYINSIKGNGRTIYIDPFKIKQSPKNVTFPSSHDHYDHFSPEDIEKVDGDNTVIVVPEIMIDKTEIVSNLVAETVSVKLGTHYVINGLEINTFPAY